ncbi:MAG: PLP-dependent aminotransferase family protein [Sandaracinaceae bacterium]|nr:PLP-dependent aminotransferase family protein [Sandaracinaceae bacterium]
MTIPSLVKDDALDKRLYEAVADRLEGLIGDGTLRPGDRIPSVRGLHRKWSVSVSTVLEAYRRLEDRGLIEARPKSGYYVRATPRALPEEPGASNPPKRARRIRGSMAYRLMAEVNRPDLVKLGAAVPHPDLLPLDALNRLIARALREAPALSHGYAVDSGHAPLRREIARRMLDAGCTLSPDDVVVTSGAQEAVYLSLRALTRPGDTVVVESPAYYGHLETLEALELKALAVRTHPREGIDLDALDEALGATRVAAVALVTSFSNPLGSVMSDAKKRALLDVLEAHDVPLVEDDVYGELPFEGPRPHAVKAFDRHGRVLYCSSFSKTISPGVRIGWCAPGRALDTIARLKLVANTASPAAPQLAIAGFLEGGGYDRHLRRLRATYRDHVRRMTAQIALTFPAGTRATRPAGGHLLWVEMPRGVDSTILYEAAARENISIAPGPMFSANGRYAHCMRLNAGLPWSQRLEDAVATLGRLAQRQLRGR